MSNKQILDAITNLMTVSLKSKLDDPDLTPEIRSELRQKLCMMAMLEDDATSLIPPKKRAEIEKVNGLVALGKKMGIKELPTFLDEVWDYRPLTAKEHPDEAWLYEPEQAHLLKHVSVWEPTTDKSGIDGLTEALEAAGFVMTEISPGIKGFTNKGRMETELTGRSLA
jgi:hypothetical protein